MIQGLLPVPRHSYTTLHDGEEEKQLTLASISNLTLVTTGKPPPKSLAPPYLRRKNFIPRTADDFGDGGAFPELHIVQYPLDMGRPDRRSSAVLAVDVDEKGQVRFDALVKQGSNKDRTVYSTIDALKEKEANTDSLAGPTEEEVKGTASKTSMALSKLIEGKIKKAQPTQIDAIREQKEPEYIRYTPNPNAPGYNSQVENRVIRMVEAQVDPMEPPKHRHRKVPRGPPSPPVPVLHSPPRKLTAQDQQAFKVPPCVSNWKNARGYTIPIDKRLAADGRGLQEATINPKFAEVAEALAVAERTASEELRARNQLRKRLSLAEKEQKEAQLRQMASQARMERAGFLDSRVTAAEDATQARDVRYRQGDNSDREDDEVEHGDIRERRTSADEGEYEKDRHADRHLDDEWQDGGSAHETEEERIARIQREKLRIERRKEREREMRMENMKGKMRQTKLARDQNRDISEKIALGTHRGGGKLSGEAMYDARLFNQSEGMDSGFGHEDEYTAYTAPLLQRNEGQSIYRPKRDANELLGDPEDMMKKLQDTSRFRPDKGFKGADTVAQGPRSQPVQFEKEPQSRDDDPFNIDKIVKNPDAHSSKRQKH